MLPASPLALRSLVTAPEAIVPVFAAAALLFASTPAAQVRWEREPYPSPTIHAMAYDSARAELVMVRPTPDGAETWTGNAGAWVLRSPSQRPPLLSVPGLVWIPTDQVVLLFGRSATGAETWTWDGRDWKDLTPSVSPPAVENAPLAYDPTRDEVVWFGGSSGGTTVLDETWVLTRRSLGPWYWSRRLPVFAPSARVGHAMAFDPVLGDVLLFGGSSTAGTFRDTWAWSGSAWRKLNPQTWPDPKSGGALTHDAGRRRTVLTGGTSTWEWTGSDWLAIPTGQSGPYDRYGTCAAYDPVRGGIIAYGGYRAVYFGDTQLWDGRTWSTLAASTVHATSTAKLVYDPVRERTVVLGPDSFAGEWDGKQWTAKWPYHTNTAPAPRWIGTAVFDPINHGVLAYGGMSTLQETWLWDGTSWRQLRTQRMPGLYGACALAWDSRRNRAVLFGGEVGRPTPDPGWQTTTWEWDGTDWTPHWAPGPADRIHHAMAYDEPRGIVVLFGGLPTPNSAVSYGDTWTYDGTGWTKVSTVGPPPRHSHTLAFDPDCGGVVLHGGVRFGAGNTVTTYRDTWVFLGDHWVQRVQSGERWDRYGHGMAYDRARREMVVFGGAAPEPLRPHGDTWTYTNTNPSEFVKYADGCGSMTLSRLHQSMPIAGRDFDLSLSGGPAGTVQALLQGFGTTTLPLGVLGHPECILRSSADVARQPDASGTVSIPLPSSSSIIGLPLFFQGVCVDPSFAQLGLTDAFAAVIGSGV